MEDEILQRLERSLNETIWDHLRIIADRLEETGDEQLAQAYRWVATHRLMPLFKRERWYWAGFDVRSTPQTTHYFTYDVWQATETFLPDRIGLNWNEAATLSEAFSRAAAAIVLAAQAGRGPLVSS